MYTSKLKQNHMQSIFRVKTIASVVNVILTTHRLTTV